MYFVLLHVFLLASGEPYSTVRTPKRPKRLILALSKPLASRWHQRLQSILSQRLSDSETQRKQALTACRCLLM